jgi:hypothetical protein
MRKQERFMTYPIVKLNLPPLPKDVEDKLLAMASDTTNFKYSSDTLLAKKELARRRGLTRIVAEVDSVQNLYGFDYIPTHKAFRLQPPITDELRSVVPVELPEATDFVVQVIDTKNTFIHDDGTRKVSFYYMMSDDATAITRFYKTESKPILETTYHPKDCEEYYSIHMDKGCWYMFDHQSVHAVTDVSKLRVGFLLDLSRVYTYEECYEKYKDIIDA